MEERKASDGGFGDGLIRFWGVMGVAAILANGLKRVVPIAAEPIRSGCGATHPWTFWSMYTGFSLFMAYVEGYEGFHRKFSPNVVTRSLTLRAGVGIAPRLLAPLYCMELFGAPAQRVIRSWSFVSAVTLVVGLVKRMPPRARAIVDAGVCTGLSMGIMSLLYHYGKFAFVGVLPPQQILENESQHENDGSISLRLSYCPVTSVTNVLNKVIDSVACAFLGRSMIHKVRADRKAKLVDQKCPISGKEGAGCPMSAILGVPEQKHNTASQQADAVAADGVDAKVGDLAEAAPKASSEFMAGKSLIASAGLDIEVKTKVSLLWSLCPVHWDYRTLSRLTAVCFLLTSVVMGRKLRRKEKLDS